MLFHCSKIVSDSVVTLLTMGKQAGDLRAKDASAAFTRPGRGK